MKTFAIILDEKEMIRVIPSKWIDEEENNFFWPNAKKGNEIQDAIIKSKSPVKDWKKYKLTKVIKSNDNYVQAVHDSKLQNIAELTDPSDDEKIKKSRSARNKKNVDSSFEEEPPKKKKKFGKNQLNSSSEQDSLENSGNDLSVNIPPLVPFTLDLTRLEDQSPSKMKKNAPEKKAPEKKTSEKETPEQQTPEKKTPERKTSEKETPEQQTPEKKTPEKKTPEKETPSTSKEKHNKQIQKKKKLSASEDILKMDVSSLTDRQIQIASFELIKKVFIKAVENDQKITKLEMKMAEGVHTSASTSKVAQLSNKDICEVSSYLPVDDLPKNKKKKMEALNEKLDEDKNFCRKMHINISRNENSTVTVRENCIDCIIDSLFIKQRRSRLHKINVEHDGCCH